MVDWTQLKALGDILAIDLSVRGDGSHELFKTLKIDDAILGENAEFSEPLNDVLLRGCAHLEKTEAPAPKDANY